MNKYYKILREMADENIDITKLYIYSAIPTDFSETESLEIMQAVYDEWLDIEGNYSVIKLCDLICENWKDYKEEKYTTDDIILDLF